MTEAELKALSDAATQGYLFAQKPDYDDGGIAIVATDYPPDKSPTNGMVLWSTMSPVERDNKDAERAVAFAAFTVALVNAYRAGTIGDTAAADKAGYERGLREAADVAGVLRDVAPNIEAAILAKLETVDG